MRRSSQSFVNHRLAVMHENGFGISQNFAEAAELYKAAAGERINLVKQESSGIKDDNDCLESLHELQDYATGAQLYVKVSEMYSKAFDGNFEKK